MAPGVVAEAGVRVGKSAAGLLSTVSGGASGGLVALRVARADVGVLVARASLVGEGAGVEVAAGTRVGVGTGSGDGVGVGGT